MSLTEVPEIVTYVVTLTEVGSFQLLNMDCMGIGIICPSISRLKKCLMMINKPLVRLHTQGLDALRTPTARIAELFGNAYSTSLEIANLSAKVCIILHIYQQRMAAQSNPSHVFVVTRPNTAAS